MQEINKGKNKTPTPFFFCLLRSYIFTACWRYVAVLNLKSYDAKHTRTASGEQSEMTAPGPQCLPLVVLLTRNKTMGRKGEENPFWESLSLSFPKAEFCWITHPTQSLKVHSYGMILATSYEHRMRLSRFYLQTNLLNEHDSLYSSKGITIQFVKMNT